MSLRNVCKIDRVEIKPIDWADATPGNRSCPRNWSGAAWALVFSALVLPAFGILQSMVMGGRVYGKMGRSVAIEDYLASPATWLFLPIVLLIVWAYEWFQSCHRAKA